MNVYKNEILQLKTMQFAPRFRLSQIIKLLN